MRTMIVVAAALCMAGGVVRAAGTETSAAPQPAEMNRHFEQARDAFQQRDLKNAAAEIRAGERIVREEANRATGKEKDGLVAAAGDLTQLANEVERGKVDSVDRLNREFARADNRLADHYQKLASESWERKSTHEASAAFEKASSYFRSAATWTGEKAEDVATGTREVTGDAITSLGHGIQRLGQKIAPDHRENATATRGSTAR